MQPSPELDEVIICEHMHWTHEEFLRQPSWFIDALRVKMSVDAAVANEKAKEVPRF